MPLYDNPLEGGLSTLGGVYATGNGGMFFRSPGDLLHALRNGNIRSSDLGQLQFGSQGAGGTFNRTNELMYGASGMAAPTGFQKGNAWFDSEAAYNAFRQQFVDVGGQRKQGWFKELFGEQPMGTQPIDFRPNTPADNPLYGQYFGGGQAPVRSAGEVSMVPANVPGGYPYTPNPNQTGNTWDGAAAGTGINPAAPVSTLQYTRPRRSPKKQRGTLGY